MSKKVTTVKLTILQWNSQSVRPKLEAFQNILFQEKVHIAALCETWLEPNSHLKVAHYNVFRKDREDAYGGVAIFVHKSVCSQVYNIRCSNPGIEILCIKVYNCSQIDYIAAVYCAPSVRTSQQDWDSVFSILNKKTLILGDFNGHHTNWSYKTDLRGSQIFDAMLDNRVITLNDGRSTRVKLVNNQLQQSTPDITLVSSDLALIFDWNILNETLGSDHMMIKITTSFNTLPENILRRNFRKADWVSYSTLLETLFTQYDRLENLQDDYNNFIEFLNIAADIHIPYIKYNSDPDTTFCPKPYWNADLSKSVAERRLALSVFRRNPTPSNLTSLNEKIRASQKLLRYVRDKSWQGMCASLDSTTTQSEMWRKMKWFKGRSSSRQYVDSKRASILLRSLSPDYVSPREPSFSSCNFKLEAPITRQELNRCIRAKDTTPGCDNISYSMINHLPDNGKLLLLSLYNDLFATGFVPMQWRDIAITPIPKPGRDPQSPSSLRPISMMSCLCKVFHSLLSNRIEWYIEKQNVLSPYTTGFRKCRSSLDNLVGLITRIQTGFTNNSTTIGCFLDIDNAYNNVNINSLMHTLDQIGVGSRICHYLWNFLKERNLKILTKGTYISRTTGRGLAQGDPISPLLFNLATLSICKHIRNDGVFVSQYADDFVLYSVCSNVKEGTQNLQNSVDILVKMLLDIGLEISPSKSKVCIFKRGYKKETTISILVNDMPLEIVDNIRYLGLWLDRTLKWSKHIAELVTKCSKSLRVFKVLAGSGWGVHPCHLRKLYISIIRSRLDYGNFLYDNGLKTSLIKLDRLQNQCMRVIGGFVKSTPIHVMQCELNIPPLHIRRYYLASKYWLKAKSFADSEIIPIVENLAESAEQSMYWRRRIDPLLVTIHETLKSYPIYTSRRLERYSLDTWVSNVDLSSIVKHNIVNVQKPKNLYKSYNLKCICEQYLLSTYSNYYAIYTDGSQIDNASGLAVFDPQTQFSIKFKLNVKVSIMYVELLAIAEAISYIESFESGNYVILTDSKSALQHLARCTSNFRGIPIAYRILDSISTLKNKSVILQWVPSHIGLFGNEEVDRLAKEAITDGIYINCLPYYSDLIYTVRGRCMDLWREYFDERSLSKGIWYRTIQPCLSRLPWYVGADMHRSEVVTAFRLRSGHIPLNSFAFLMNKCDSPNCTQCNVVEDVTHILAECVRNEAERYLYILENNINKSDVGVFNSILAAPLSREAKMLFRIVNLGIKRK